MPTLFMVALIAAIGVAAFVRARRAGLWSWRRFGVTTLVLVLVGGGIGFAAAVVGRRLGSQHALLLTVAAAAAIVAGVFAFAMATRRRHPPR